MGERGGGGWKNCPKKATFFYQKLGVGEAEKIHSKFDITIDPLHAVPQMFFGDRHKNFLVGKQFASSKKNLFFVWGQFSNFRTNSRF